jgi:hypothetical protein
MIENIDTAVRFLQRFHRDLHPAPGLDPELIPEDLPYGLALIYRELGALVEIEPSKANNYKAPFCTQDCLVPLSRLKRVDGLIEFAWENQGNWSARCSIGQSDPPAQTNAGDGAGATEFEVVCDSLNDFLVTLSLQEAVMSAPVLYNFPTSEAADVFEVPLRALWLQGPYAVRGFWYDFFEIPGEDAIVMNYGDIWVGARSRTISRFLKPQRRSYRLD